MLFLLVIVAFALAFANGANDNFKGVATLFGSGTLRYRQALWVATGATAAGAVISAALAENLARTFSGMGLVPGEIAGSGPFLAIVGGSAALTILIATWLGMPTSTTHALTGALVGAALVAGDGTASFLPVLTGKFLLPLVVSPLLALTIAAGLDRLLSGQRGNEKGDESSVDECLCLGQAEARAIPVGDPSWAQAVAVVPSALSIGSGSRAECEQRYTAATLRFRPMALVDGAHILSAGAVCFARAVNDTPKIAAILLASSGPAGPSACFVLVALAMILGGVLQSRKVAETMSRRITPISPPQGLAANLVTASLVLGASHFGAPVSTTHVSVGSLFGLGLASRSGRWKTILRILATWITTLPLALAFSAIAWLAWANWSSLT